MYEKTIDIEPRANITLAVECDEVITIESNDNWRDSTVITLSINDAKRLRKYLTEAINFATMNKEDK